MGYGPLFLTTIDRGVECGSSVMLHAKTALHSAVKGAPLITAQ